MIFFVQFPKKSVSFGSKNAKTSYWEQRSALKRRVVLKQGAFFFWWVCEWECESVRERNE